MRLVFVAGYRPGAGGAGGGQEGGGFILYDFEVNRFVEVEGARLDLRCHDQTTAELPAPDQAVRHGQAVQESRAGGGQIKRRGPLCAQTLLKQARGGRERHVRRRRGHQDGLHRRGTQTRSLAGPAGGALGEVGTGLLLAGPVARPDPGPPVHRVGIQAKPWAYLGIAHHSVRKIGPGSDDPALPHGTPPWPGRVRRYGPPGRDRRRL